MELRRTISTTLGENTIEFVDEFFNAGNETVPHAWLLHINFGYPLVDEGAELCYDSPKVEPMDAPLSKAYFVEGVNYKKVYGPLPEHHGENSVVGYVYPKADRSGRTTAAIVNRKLSVGVAVHYNTREFPRCGNWQHFGKHEYVTAIEPMNGTVEGRDKDRARGLLDHLRAGQRKSYTYSIEVISDRGRIDELRKLNT